MGSAGLKGSLTLWDDQCICVTKCVHHLNSSLTQRHHWSLHMAIYVELPLLIYSCKCICQVLLNICRQHIKCYKHYLLDTSEPKGLFSRQASYIKTAHLGQC